MCHTVLQMPPSSLDSLRSNIAILIAVLTAFAIVSFSVLFLRIVQLALQIAAEEDEEISLVSDQPSVRITIRSASSAITPETRMVSSDSKRTPTTKYRTHFHS
ncbi:hypothetical protein DdX_08783 [Ditylenchus destructor]|uniref:Uncharacterized protein n=1 Tax=Ditylenchus destructor TaxID=166010 RepID=A0AAD4R0L7_9BILA|nr:hypothetical protein DdX_08783 [Ditylenchus destructor]